MGRGRVRNLDTVWTWGFDQYGNLIYLLSKMFYKSGSFCLCSFLYFVVVIVMIAEKTVRPVL